MVTPAQVVMEVDVSVVGAVPIAVFSAGVKAAPLDLETLDALAAVLVGDVTSTVANKVSRVLTARFVPSVLATATATKVPGDAAGSPVNELLLGSTGDGYAAPPIVSFQPQPGDPDPQIAAQATAKMQVTSVNVVNGGTGYSNQTTVRFDGGEPEAGFSMPVVSAIVRDGAGVITSIVAVGGGPYNVPPRVTIIDPGGGTGAFATSNLGVASLDLWNPGRGYANPPSVVFTPLFVSSFPFTSDQKAPFRNLFTSQIARAVRAAASSPEPALIP